jgi:hypothetical protein
LQKGTDLVIITDGCPAEESPLESQKIQAIIQEHKGCVWLIDLIGNANRNKIPDGWQNLKDTYIPIKTLSDLEKIVPIMKNALRKIK